MRTLGRATQYLGVVLIFAGLGWMKGPAVVLADYGYALALTILGALVLIVGIRILRCTRAKPDETNP